MISSMLIQPFNFGSTRSMRRRPPGQKRTPSPIYRIGSSGGQATAKNSRKRWPRAGRRSPRAGLQVCLPFRLRAAPWDGEVGGGQGTLRFGYSGAPRAGGTSVGWADLLIEELVEHLGAGLGPTPERAGRVRSDGTG